MLACKYWTLLLAIGSLLYLEEAVEFRAVASLPSPSQKGRGNSSSFPAKKPAVLLPIRIHYINVNIHKPALGSRPTLHSRRLHQTIDPLGSALNTLKCVNDTTVLPFSAVGRIEANSSANWCMATAIAANVVYTNRECISQADSARYYTDGSHCSTTHREGAGFNVLSVYKPDATSQCGSSPDTSCLTANGLSYALAQIESNASLSSLPYESYTSSRLSNVSINAVSWTGKVASCCLDQQCLDTIILVDCNIFRGCFGLSR